MQMVLTRREIEDIYGMDTGEISNGCVDIVRYCHEKKIPIPAWFDPSFGELPRYCHAGLDDDLFENWFSVRISSFQKQSRIDNYRSGIPILIAGAMFTWIIENLKGEWRCSNYRDFSFEEQQDAMLFRLIWG